MNDNASAIAVFCSHLCVGEVNPLEPREWGNLAQILLEKKIEPFDLLSFGCDEFVEKLGVSEELADRLYCLTKRQGSLFFEISKYDNMGIKILTRADEGYPRKLKAKIGYNCPPLFYYAGDLALLKMKAVGFVGSREVDKNDVKFTKLTVEKVLSNGYAITTGGARGIDRTSVDYVIKNGGYAVEFLADSMLKRMREPETITAIQEGRLLLLSVVKPDSGFNTGIAMMRNKYIYAQSCGTVVIKADYNKGGTWSGATENLKNNYCKEFCYDNKNYKGNVELIKMGAIPIDGNWDGNVEASPDNPPQETFEQISIFKL